jgi:hypothetical protein
LQLFFAELFHKLLDLPALTHAVARGVMHWASGASTVATGSLTVVLVSSWASAPTHHDNCSCGGTSQQLVIAASLLVVVVVVVVVVATALSGGLYVRLAILS